MKRGRVVRTWTLEKTQRRPNNRGATLGKHNKSWTVKAQL